MYPKMVVPKSDLFLPMSCMIAFFICTHSLAMKANTSSYGGMVWIISHDHIEWWRRLEGPGLLLHLSSMFLCQAAVWSRTSEAASGIKDKLHKGLICGSSHWDKDHGCGSSSCFGCFVKNTSRVACLFLTILSWSNSQQQKILSRIPHVTLLLHTKSG